MKPKKVMVIKIPGYTARKLYYQGQTICTSPDGYTTQNEVQQLLNPVSDSFFQQPDCMYGFVVPQDESDAIREFQKQGIINMAIAGFTGITCIHFLAAYTMFKNYWFLIGFLTISYMCVHYWVKIFEAVKPENNKYLQVLSKYGISMTDEEK